MRLRLRIERNELPAIQILWAIPRTSVKQTISQFLTAVNERFPLEGNTWGLDDYSVTVAGYEATHYSEIGETFKDEDEVVIKPLGWGDLKVRMLTGREQISVDGRHLLDGVPFGRQLLKKPRRPDVNIPARKRPRIEGSGSESGESAVVVYQGDRDVDSEDDDENDGDFEDDGDGEDEENGVFQGRLEDDDDDDEGEDGDFGGEAKDDDEQQENGQREESQSDNSSDDSNSNAETESSDDSSHSSSDSSDSSSDGDEEEASPEKVVEEQLWNRITETPSTGTLPQNATPRKDITKASSVQNVSEKATPINGMTRVRSAEVVPEKATPTLQKFGLPYQGDSATKERNARRREQKKLKHLKENGALPSHFTLRDMYDWQANQDLNNPATKTSVDRSRMEKERQRLLDQISAGGVEIDATSTRNHVHEDEDGPPEEISSRPSAVSIGGQQHTDASPDTQIIAEMQAASDNQAAAGPDQAPPAKRARVDLKGMHRLVFGSLGLRTPKTQVEKDALQKKLAALPKRAGRSQVAEGSSEPIVEEDEDPEAWRDRIILTAVECVDEDVTLQPPPFPFQQRWDPQYQYDKKRSASSTKPKRSKKRRIEAQENGYNGDYIETYDKYNKDGTGDALDYDDPEDDDFDDTYWEEGALLDGDEEEVEDNGFPDLPSHSSTLKTLPEADAVIGDFITYQELSVSAATNWEPRVVSQIAKLEAKKDDGSWRLSVRDTKPKEYDENGKRIFRKFEMENFSDTGDGEEGKIVRWSELQDVRLLQKGAS